MVRRDDLFTLWRTHSRRAACRIATPKMQPTGQSAWQNHKMNQSQSPFPTTAVTTHHRHNYHPSSLRYAPGILASAGSLHFSCTPW